MSFMNRKPSLNGIRNKLKIVSLGIVQDVKGSEEIARFKYPEANEILQSAEDLFRLAEIVDGSLDGLLAKLNQYKENRGNK